MKQLYRVEIVVMVMAETPYDAKQVAVSNCQVDEAEAVRALSTPSQWYDSIPYGADDDLTVGEILTWKRGRQDESLDIGL